MPGLELIGEVVPGPSIDDRVAAQGVGDLAVWAEVRVLPDDNGEMIRSDDDRQAADRAARRSGTIAINKRSRPTDGIPVGLLGLLVSTGVWSVPQTLSHAQALVNPWDRSKALVHIAAYLGPAELGQALSTAIAIGKESVRADALAGGPAR